jgi:hypothetical protein
MKSNLVDALRRAQEEKSETALSDSGSFDATQDEFTAPANQDMADAEFREDAAELELMSTTRGLAVNDIGEVSDVAAGTDMVEVADDADEDVEQMPAQFGETMASATVFLTGSDCVIPESGSLPSMPRLARHVPVLCLVLALVAGAGWQAYQRLELRQDVSALGAFGVPSQAAGESQDVVLADEPGMRFRYLSGPLTPSEDEATQ